MCYWKPREVLMKGRWWDSFVACRFHQPISRSFGVKYCKCLSSGEGFPDVLLLRLGLESQGGGGCVGVCYSILWTSVCVWNSLSWPLSCRPHPFDLRVILSSVPASENQPLESNLKYGRFSHTMLAHCWFTCNSKMFEIILYVQFWGQWFSDD